MQSKLETAIFGDGYFWCTEGIFKMLRGESYYKDYYVTNRGNPYCELVINPKLEKVQKQFSALLKNQEGR